MKRGTPDHPKTKRLAELLKLARWQVVGLLESLWHFTSNYAKRGDIGKWSNAEIASHLEWSQCAPDELIAALINSRLVDECSQNRLLVHDWEDHCDQTVRRSEEVKNLGFAKQSPVVVSTLLSNVSQPGQSQSQSQSQSPAKAGTSVQPLATNGAPEPEPEAGIFKCVTPELLRDNAQLMAWFKRATSQKKPVVQKSEANLQRVFTAAEHALSKGIENPAANFAWMVSSGEWKSATQADEDRARRRLKEHQDQVRGPPLMGQVLASAIASEKQK